MEVVTSMPSVDAFLESIGGVDDDYQRRVLPVAKMHMPNSRGDHVRRLLNASVLPPGRNASSFQEGFEVDEEDTVEILPRKPMRNVQAWLHSHFLDEEGESECSVISVQNGDPSLGAKNSVFSSSTTKCSFFSSQTTHPHFASVTQSGLLATSLLPSEMGLSAFEPTRVVGKGAYGIVCQVSRKSTQQHYAMKIQDKFSIVKARGEMGLQQARTERDVLCSISHPYIIPLFWSFQTNNHLIFVMKLCPGGDLTTLIQRLKRIHPAQACLYSAEVLLALCHLHERRIIHRDVKPDNILIDEQGHAMLTDFGISKGGIDGPKDASSFCGTPAFCAPEVLKREGYGRGIDVYGLGLLAFNMLAGELPFQGEEVWVIKASICAGKFTIPSFVPKDAESFIQRTMEKTAKKRLGAMCTPDVKNHEFFSTMDWDALMRREVTLSKMGFRQRVRSKLRRSESQKEITDAVSEAKKTFTTIQRCRKSQGVLENWDYVMLE